MGEHAVALVLSLNRKTHKACYRTRDGMSLTNEICCRCGRDLCEKRHSGRCF